MMHVWRLSDVCLYVAYIGPKSRTERPRKTKIGTEVVHVTRDSDTTFKLKRSKVNLQGRGRIVAASSTACWILFNCNCNYFPNEAIIYKNYIITRIGANCLVTMTMSGHWNATLRYVYNAIDCLISNRSKLITSRIWSQIIRIMIVPRDSFSVHSNKYESTY